MTRGANICRLSNFVPRLCESTYSRMRTTKASPFLAGGRGAGGLCPALRMRVSSWCFLWLSFKKSSKRLNFNGLPFDTYKKAEIQVGGMYTSHDWNNILTNYTPYWESRCIELVPKALTWM